MNGESYSFGEYRRNGQDWSVRTTNFKLMDWQIQAITKIINGTVTKKAEIAYTRLQIERIKMILNNPVEDLD